MGWRLKADERHPRCCLWIRLPSASLLTVPQETSWETLTCKVSRRLKNFAFLLRNSISCIIAKRCACFGAEKRCLAWVGGMRSRNKSGLAPVAAIPSKDCTSLCQMRVPSFSIQKWTLLILLALSIGHALYPKWSIQCGGAQFNSATSGWNFDAAKAGMTANSVLKSKDYVAFCRWPSSLWQIWILTWSYFISGMGLE